MTRSFASLFAICLLLLATIVLLYVGAALVRESDTVSGEADRHLSSLRDAVEKRISTLLLDTQLVLVGVSEFMGAHFDGLDVSLSSNATFARYVGQVQGSAPHITAIAFAPIVPVAEISAFEARVRHANAPLFDSYVVNRSGELDTAVFPLLYRYPQPLPSSNYPFGRDVVVGAARRVAVEEAVRSGAPVASEPVMLFTTQQLSVNLYSGCWRYDQNRTLVGIAIALFPFADVVGTVLPGIENDVARLEWFDASTNRSLFSWSDSAALSVKAVKREFNVSFAHRMWRIELGLRDSSDDNTAVAQVAVPIVFVCASVAFLTAIAIVFRARTVVARENGQQQLLSMIFPPHIATALINRLQVRDGRVSIVADGGIAQLHEQVTLIFIDMCDFTTISSFLEPRVLVRFVNEFVCIIDRALARYPRLLKIKTIGDAYFVAAGLGDERVESSTLPYHVQSLADALAFCVYVQREVQDRHRFRVELKADDALGGSAFLRRPSSLLSSSRTVPRAVLEERRSERAFLKAYDPATGELAVLTHRCAYWYCSGGRLRARAARVRCMGRHVQRRRAARERGHEWHHPSIASSLRYFAATQSH